jgi:fatty-acyl-CoA synthase
MKTNKRIDPLIEITIADKFDEIANAFPNNDAMIFPHENIRYTYSELQAVVNKVARGFMSMGIKKGDNVAIWATNVPEWLLTMFATAKIGAVLVTVNTSYKQFELEYLLRQSDSMTLVMTGGFKDSDYIAHLRACCPEIETCKPGEICNETLPYLKNVIYAGNKEDMLPGMYHFDELYALAENVSEEALIAEQASLDAHDIINMQYTSGTTGFPKGVMLTSYNIVNNGKCIGDCMNLTHEDRLCITVPLFHCFGMVLAVLAALTHGTAMVVVERYHPLKVMQAVEMERCTALHGVPTMFIGILEHPDFKKCDFSSLRTGIMAGSPCPTKVMQQVVNEMHMSEITITYGLTESSPAMTMSSTDDPLELRVATVGKRMPHCEVKIVDPETGLECEPGVPGEIMTRGYHIMKGYYKMPEATALAIEPDGWLHSGDVGTVDENGYFKITGRLKDMIIRGGENIYPREIEEFLYTNEKVRDVQVVGVPDKKYGEEVMACIILQDKARATDEEIILFVKNGLSRYKAPRYVMFLDELPMTASGKIQKYKLREMAIEKLNLQDAANVETA